MSNTVSLLSAAQAKLGQGDAAGAERLYRQVLASEPQNLAAGRGLGAILLEQGRLQESFNALSAASRTSPTDPELLILMGRCLHSAGQIPAATRALETAVQRDPRSAPARIWLARCRTASQRAGEALAMLEPLAASHPSDALVRTALGQALWALGRREEAIAHLRAAAELRPGAATHADLGWALHTAGQPDEALVEFDRALALHPRLALAAAGKAAILTDRGRNEEARAVIQQVLDQGVLDVMLATTYARLSKAPEQRRAARAVLERSITLAQAPGAKASLLQSLGTLKEADGEYDAAFECFRASNEQTPSVFDGAGMERSTDEIIRVFSKENMARLPRSNNEDRTPVFIVGMPRSGTTLVEQILASHPAVFGAGELEDLAQLAVRIPALVRLAPAARYPSCVLSLTRDQMDQLSRMFITRLHHLGGAAEIVTDKMPRDFVFLGLIDLLFPGARVIHCMRHPLDTCLSCYATPLSQAHSYRTRLRDLAAVYRAYHRLMEHWRSVVRVPILDVRYEELVADAEPQSRRLVEFVGLPWDDRCLRFHETRRVVSTASVDQVRRPIYNSSINRWRNYERHLGDLVEGLRGLY